MLLTEKDAVKLRPARLRALQGAATTRVWVVALDFRPDAGYANDLLARLDPLRRADATPLPAPTED